MLRKKIKKNKRFNMLRSYRHRNQVKRIFVKFLRWNLRQYIRNEEFLKYPFYFKIYRSKKKWKKPELMKWRNFKSMYIYSTAFNNFNKRDLRRFKSFKKEVFFWFKSITKRRLFLMSKRLIVKKKKFKKLNYFKLKKKFSVKEKFSLNNIKKSINIFKLIKFKYIIKNYLNFILKKNKFFFKFKYNNENFFNLFIKLNNLFLYFKNLLIYNKQLYKYFLIYKDFILNKKLVHIRSKWIDRIRRKRKFIYRNYKFSLLAKKFFRIKKKLFFIFFQLKDYYKNFYYLKVRTVDTNIFITLTNYKHEVIIYRSTGHVSLERRRKIKLSPQTVSNMIFDIIKKIKSLKIKYIIIHINSKMNKYVRSVYRTIGRSTNLYVVKAEFSKPIPHHFGTRKPKPKRL